MEPNWIGFRLNQHDRHELLGDFRYFIVEDCEFFQKRFKDDANRAEIFQKGLQAEYDRVQRSYDRARDQYKAGTLELRSPIRIGGGSAHYNYASSAKTIVLDKSDRENMVPIMPDGSRFHFIADVQDAGEYGCCNVTPNLFFEPKSRTALITFDGT